MYKLIRCFAPVVLVLFFCGLFVIPSWAMVPFFPSGRSPSMMVVCPIEVGYNEVFTAKIIFDKGSCGFNGLISTWEVLPEGFEVLRHDFHWDKGVLGFDNIWYTVDIKAPNRRVDYEKLTFKMKYFMDGGMNESSGDFNINVRDPLRIKYGFDPSKVPPDYNGNINLAVVAESLPIFIPCGYFMLGQGFGGEENTLLADSAPARLFETVGFFGAFVPGADYNFALGMGVYLGSLLFYDLPNLYKYHDEKLEIAKLKREGQIK